MTFTIELEHFRVFNQTGPVRIRPITLLTGGNSAGKSSFLAALRYLSDMDYLGSTGPSFNKDPFLLGSYEQIAHYRGGKAGRSKYFKLGFSGPAQRFYPQPRRSTQQVSFSLKFAKRLSQPTIQELIYTGETSEFGLRFSDDWKTVKVNASVGPKRYSANVETSSLMSPDAITQNPLIATYLIDTLFDDPKRPERHDTLIQLSELNQEIRSGLSAIPRTSYVGAPVRTRPSRTYDPIDTSQHSEGSHVPSQLAQLVRTDPNAWAEIHEALIRFGKASSLYTDIEVRSLGRSDSDPFQLNVTINGPRRNIMDVGYGVSQALPIIFELIRRARNSLFIIQQPEVHLHPEAQAALGTFIAGEIKRTPGYVIIETHSDFLIDRVRRHIREGLLSPEDVSLLYFDRKGLYADIIDIPIDTRGDIVDAPESYRDFFFREQMENLGLDVLDN